MSDVALCPEELALFGGAPRALELYCALKEALLAAHPAMTLKCSRTQIAFRNRYGFAVVSRPRMKIEGGRDAAILVSFGLAYKKDAPRIVQSVEAYPNRWTHHVPVRNRQEIDEELMGWLEEAWHFSMGK